MVVAARLRENAGRVQRGPIPCDDAASLARPSELQMFLRAQENGEEYARDAFLECLERSVGCSVWACQLRHQRA